MRKFEYVFYYNATNKQDISIRDILHEIGLKGINLLYIVNNYSYVVHKFFDDYSFSKNVKMLKETSNIKKLSGDLYFAVFEEETV